jgi:hypothetical protein
MNGIGSHKQSAPGSPGRFVFGGAIAKIGFPTATRIIRAPLQKPRSHAKDAPLSFFAFLASLQFKWSFSVKPAQVVRNCSAIRIYPQIAEISAEKSLWPSVQSVDSSKLHSDAQPRPCIKRAAFR